MARGFLTGVFAGAVTGGIVLSGASLLSDLPVIETPVMPASPAAPETPEQSGSGESGSDAASTADQAEAPPAEVETAVQPTTEPEANDVANTAPQSESSPGSAPEISSSAGGLTTPGTDADTAAQPEITPAAPSGEQAGSPISPSAPASGANDRIAALPQVGADDPGPQAAPAGPVQPDATESQSNGSSLVQIETLPTAAATPESGPEAPVSGSSESPVAVDAPSPAPVAGQDAETESIESDGGENHEAEGDGGENDLSAGEDDGDTPEEAVVIPVEPAPVATAPGIGNRVVRFTDRGQNGADADRGQSQGAAAVADADSDMGALARNAIEFTNAGQRPLYAIVLIDDGAEPDAAKIAQALPFPVSVVVDAANPRAGADASDWRSAGSEVLLRLSLPAGAGPQDIETGVLSATSAVPDAVAVFDQPPAAPAVGRGAAAQLAQALAETGHGLVLYSRGLNTSRQLAEREGVPNAMVFRTFDDDGQSVPVMRRMLDRAGFRAEQEGHVIMVGHLRKDTIRAITEWSLEDRASGVAIAPVSAVLDPR